MLALEFGATAQSCECFCGGCQQELACRAVLELERNVFEQFLERSGGLSGELQELNRTAIGAAARAVPEESHPPGQQRSVHEDAHAHIAPEQHRRQAA